MCSYIRTREICREQLSRQGAALLNGAILSNVFDSHRKNSKDSDPLRPIFWTFPTHREQVSVSFLHLHAKESISRLIILEIIKLIACLTTTNKSQQTTSQQVTTISCLINLQLVNCMPKIKRAGGDPANLISACSKFLSFHQVALIHIKISLENGTYGGSRICMAFLFLYFAKRQEL